MNKHNYDNEIACPSQTGSLRSCPSSSLSPSTRNILQIVRETKARVSTQCVARFFLSDVAESKREAKQGKRFGVRDDAETLNSEIQFSIKLSRVHISSRLRLADVLLLLKTLFVIVTSLYHLHHQQVEQQSQINLIDKLAVGEWETLLWFDGDKYLKSKAPEKYSRHQSSRHGCGNKFSEMTASVFWKSLIFLLRCLVTIRVELIQLTEK